MKNPIINITFKSEQSPKEVYSIFLKSLKDAIALNGADPVALENIRKDLMENLAMVERLQYSKIQAR